MAKKAWKMPDWMEPHRERIGNTGGNSVEELMNMEGVNMQNNCVLAALCIAVESQVSLLAKLHRDGFL